MSHVAWFVCLCVGHAGVLCKNGWVDRDAVWGIDPCCGPKEPCITLVLLHETWQLGGYRAHWKALGLSLSLLRWMQHSVLNNGMTVRLLQPTAMLQTCRCHFTFSPVKNPPLRCGLSLKCFDHLLWFTAEFSGWWFMAISFLCSRMVSWRKWGSPGFMPTFVRFCLPEDV